MPAGVGKVKVRRGKVCVLGTKHVSDTKVVRQLVQMLLKGLWSVLSERCALEVTCATGQLLTVLSQHWPFIACVRTAWPCCRW